VNVFIRSFIFKIISFVNLTLLPRYSRLWKTCPLLISEFDFDCISFIYFRLYLCYLTDKPMHLCTYVSEEGGDGKGAGEVGDS
jgi:hypothetical protein